MYILITNDDGFRSEGIKALAKEATNRGHSVIVSAPAFEQSAKSHSITLGHPLISKKRPSENGATVYSVQGTPVDAVRIGLEVSDGLYDFCVSGINDGLNAGPAVYYSGTVAAAREAAMNGIPAVAVSIDVGADQAMLENAAKLALDLMEKLQGENFKRGVYASINLPALPPEDLKELTLCKTAFLYFEDRYEHRLSPQGTDYYWLKGDVLWKPAQKGTDIYFLERGYPTLCFLGDMIDHADSYKHLFPNQ